MLLVKLITRLVDFVNYIYRYFSSMIFLIKLRDTAVLILIRYTYSPD